MWWNKDKQAGDKQDGNEPDRQLRSDFQSYRALAVLHRVRQLEIHTNRLAQNIMAGRYRSLYQGSGMDFDEVRQYSPGDEIRTIDWNVSARMGQPFVKKFQEEREMSVMLLVDISESGVYGSARAKRDLVAEVAGVLAFSALRAGDRVGLVLFTDQVELYLPPDKSRGQVLRILREILFFEPEGVRTDLGVPVDFVTRMLKRRAVTFLISDFCGTEAFDEELLALRPKLVAANCRHDVIACAVNDPWEFDLSSLGLITLEDVESGEQVELDTGRADVRKAYAKEAKRRRDALSRQLRGNGIDLIELRTDRPYLPALNGFFELRKRRKTR